MSYERKTPNALAAGLKRFCVSLWTYKTLSATAPSAVKNKFYIYCPPRTHTFISHALAGGRTLAEVRDAAGHANVTVTSRYLHVAVCDDAIGQLFAER